MRATSNDLEAAVRAQAEKAGIRLADGVTRLLAETARGVDWEALRLLDRALDQLAIRRGGDRLLLDDVRKALRIEGFDDRGLTRGEQQVLQVVEERGPVSASHIAALVGRDRATVEERIEPVLLELDLIAITDRGRVPRGWTAPVESTDQPHADEPADLEDEVEVDVPADGVARAEDRPPSRVAHRRDRKCHGGYPPRSKTCGSARYFARIGYFLLA